MGHKPYPNFTMNMNYPNIILNYICWYVKVIQFTFENLKITYKITKMLKTRWIWLAKISIVMAINVERLVEDNLFIVDVFGGSLTE